MGRIFDFSPPEMPRPRREHSLGQVVPINRPRTTTPSTAPALFDQDASDPRRGVYLLGHERAFLANLIRQARQSRLMNPQHVDEALWLLDGRRPKDVS